MDLAELQRRLAAGLTGHGPGLEGMDPSVLKRARSGLESKRRRAAAHLLPRLRAFLGSGWKDSFAAHARRYTPTGLLSHVDDAWEMAETLTQGPDREAARAARADLAELRRRWARGRKPGVGRIRERKRPLLAFLKRVFRGRYRS